MTNDPQSAVTARIGIDLGGTKIELRATCDDGDFTERAATPRGDYEGTVDVIRKLVENARPRFGAQSPPIGIGIPGAVDRETGTIKNANSNWLIDRPLGRDLEAALGTPVRLANDANCFALSEAIDGAGTDCQVVFGVILGTGVGGGLVVGRSLIEGANRIAGEWGHIPLPPSVVGTEMRPCYCGHTNCVELFLSGPALVGEFSALGGHADRVEDILAAEADGNSMAAGVLDRFYERLAASLAVIINIVDPDIFVFGGGLSNIEKIPQEMSARVPRYVFSASRAAREGGIATRFSRNHWGDSGGARGAAWLWG